MPLSFLLNCLNSDLDYLQNDTLFKCDTLSVNGKISGTRIMSMMLGRNKENAEALILPFGHGGAEF